MVVLLLCLRMLLWPALAFAGWHRAGAENLGGAVVAFFLIGAVTLWVRRARMSLMLRRSTGTGLRDIGGVYAAEETRFFVRDVVFSVLSCTLAYGVGVAARAMLSP